MSNHQGKAVEKNVFGRCSIYCEMGARYISVYVICVIIILNT